MDCVQCYSQYGRKMYRMQLALCSFVSGCKAAVHALRTIFEDEESEAVLLVDASNAFNALHNIMSVCPSLATTVINS